MGTLIGDIAPASSIVPEALKHTFTEQPFKKWTNIINSDDKEYK